MNTREQLISTDLTNTSWLGFADDAQPYDDDDATPRPDMSRGAGGHVTPSAALAMPTGVGMDPTAPGTWTRPYVPTEGMFARLHREAGSR
jgi:hypothetical protein